VTPPAQAARSQHAASMVRPQQCLAALLHLATSSSALHPPGRTTFFVAPSGDDSAAGGLSQPFRTLARARDAVRALKPRPDGGVAIHLRAGVYTTAAAAGALDVGCVATLELGAEDSGTEDRPVVWRAHPGERVLISGGVAIPDAAFSPRPGHAGVFQANLTALGLQDLGAIQEALTPRQGGPANGSSPRARPELFFRGKPMTLARWPNMNAQRQPEWSFTHGVYPHGCGGTNKPNCTGFVFDPSASSAPQHQLPAKLVGWHTESQERDPWLHGYFQWDFADGFTPMRGVTSTNSGLTAIISGKKVGTGFQNDPSKAGARFAALNLLSELDAEEEYYIERSSGSPAAAAAQGMIYFKPPASATASFTGASPVEIDGAFVSSAPAVIRLSNQTAFVRFENLRIEHSTGSAVQGPGPALPGASPANVHWPFPGNHFVRNISFLGCVIANTGGGGVEIHNCRGCALSDGEISGVAGIGVMLAGGLRRSLLAGDNLISNNSIHHTSRWVRTMQPGIFFAGVANHFVGNHIFGLPHQAIMGGGNQALCGVCHWLPHPAECDAQSDMDDAVCSSNDNIFEGNYIHDTTFETVDSGSFYSCGQLGTGYTNRGNVVTGNRFENVVMNHTRLALLQRAHIADIAKSFGNQVVAVIYMDDTMSSFSFVNNTIINGDYAVLVHGGRDNIIQRNAFISTRYGVFLAPDGIPTSGFNHFQMWVAQRAFNEIRVSASWPAWITHYGGEAPQNFQQYLNTIYLVQNNSMIDNTYCNMHPGPFCVSYDVKRCLTNQMNWTVYDKTKNGCCCDNAVVAKNFSCPQDAKRCV
jgi:hypothetical protein